MYKYERKGVVSVTLDWFWAIKHMETKNQNLKLVCMKVSVYKYLTAVLNSRHNPNQLQHDGTIPDRFTLVIQVGSTVRLSKDISGEVTILIIMRDITELPFDRALGWVELDCIYLLTNSVIHKKLMSTDRLLSVKPFYYCYYYR
ncbi:hypothetical protein PHYBLDRAFT_66211 [Phycomyces blakesleeanus NRRL 1555(-)]|uniref:Uncharacterized protein n=1 Tax=Phycomyces blakesleeanus (strain ATCC 8743b / DSM 1359 / FGSC 10004 / NBRC 33097 / NRRL 1555) TaxID=763407 RepID=A0A162NH44_PHYB8|nr:hypothetical protein PHYBLDRAFT_66211 [Phycomyces blakesleeanus NRRL 1555(-)]OAD69564.1 hypothetical protein PHYBLDRAFT_66211 [Phycomyces blakesleeanus NRRL 1555(-)]|eukprot:XP_018287604.1 hypothetical protein PHYBLDRAFT_66211 [Phycomyces blakesleeanus NRRL 1555(-)]